MGPVPKNVIFLTADAFGVLPPIARLTPDQAMYHFLSGYTAKVAGTEIGVTEPEATFSTCFGAPFMPRHPSVYGNLLKERIAKGGVDCWLVNTGWTGGKYGVGSRMPIKATRALLNAALDGSLNDVEFRTRPQFRLRGAGQRAGRRDARSSTRATPGPTRTEYDATAARLVKLFIDNFAKFAAHVDAGVLAAAPAARPAPAPNKSRRPSSPRPDAQPPAPFRRERAGGRRAPFLLWRTDNERPRTAAFRRRRRDPQDRRGPARPHACPRPNGPTRPISPTCAWLILERPDIAPERDLPDLIRRYNESVGGVNDETQGYHETITQVFIRGVRLSLARSGGAGAGRAGQRAAAARREGRRDWPLRFYSRERLFSVEARLGWVEPDLACLPAVNGALAA